MLIYIDINVTGSRQPKRQTVWNIHNSIFTITQQHIIDYQPRDVLSCSGVLLTKFDAQLCLKLYILLLGLFLGWVPPPDIPEDGSAVERLTDQPFAPHDPCLGQPVLVAPFPLAGKFVSAGVS